MNIPDNGKQRYIEAKSLVALAKEWDVSLVTLEAYANEQGWDREHKLYWQDKAIEMLKNAASEDNITAVRELLKAMGISRPVGRPSKTEVTKQIAIEAKIEQEFSADIARLASYAKQA